MSTGTKLALIITVLLLVPVAALLRADDVKWYEDFEQAKKIAAQQGKDLLIDFTGSDWCPWCWRLNEEVFDLDAFKEEAPKHFVLVKLDYPRDKSKMAQKIIDQNDKILAEYKEKYKFTGYPNIYLASAEGIPYAKTGYREGGPEKYNEHLAFLKKARPMEDAGSKWIEDFEIAKAKAQFQGKDMLVDFTGSDWCSWCWRLNEEVFDRDAFKNAAPKSFVLVKLDYPRDTSKMAQEIINQNKRLQEEYPFPGFPTIYLMDAQGRPYAQTGYQEGGPEKYLESLRGMLQIRMKRDEFLAQSRGKVVVKDSERLRVPLEPREKARLLDQALSVMDEGIVDKFYSEQVKQIIELDAENTAGLKAKYAMRLSLNEAKKALSNRQYQKAVEIIQAVIEDFNLTGEDAQELLFAQCEGFFYLKDIKALEKGLRKAYQAAPKSKLAPNTKMMFEQFFPGKDITKIK